MQQGGRGVIAALVAIALTVTAGVIAWPMIGKLAARTATMPEAQEVEYVVVPHPDDEFQAWSLIEHEPTTYKVFILATHGEETGFCERRAYRAGWQEELEPAAEPVPGGRWTKSCSRARLNSWIGFLDEQADADPSLPDDFSRGKLLGPFPDPREVVCRRDAGPTCVDDGAGTSARVWIARNGRGAAIAFDLGDGDLTREEVAWAVRTVMRNRDDLRIDNELPDGALIAGSFANQSYDCFSYPHPDHVAVHEALFNVDFGLEFQAAPTCAGDPDASLSDVVSRKSARAAFEIGPDGERLGAHTRNYGWLHRRYYPLDRRGQDELFHTHQEFWVRFAE